MPIFEFRCAACHERFEALVASWRAEGVACPACGAADPERLISTFAVSRSLTPCGTPASDARASCGYNARTGGCGGCCEN